MARVGAPWEPMGSSSERGRRGRGERRQGERLGVAWGGGGLQEGRQACSLAATTTLCSLAAIAARLRRNVPVRKKRRRKERRKKMKEKKREKKRKKYGNFSKLENIWGEK
jgi:hypothetical protein